MIPNTTPTSTPCVCGHTMGEHLVAVRVLTCCRHRGCLCNQFQDAKLVEHLEKGVEAGDVSAIIMDLTKTATASLYDRAGGHLNISATQVESVIRHTLERFKVALEMGHKQDSQRLDTLEAMLKAIPTLEICYCDDADEEEVAVGLYRVGFNIVSEGCQGRRIDSAENLRDALDLSANTKQQEHKPEPQQSCGLDCPRCSGEYCGIHGHRPCDCDTLDRHQI